MEITKMQEDDQELRDEYNQEQSGYDDWLSDNIGDLKAEFMTEQTAEELVTHFYWDEKTVEDFFNKWETEFDEHCKTAWDSFKDLQDTESMLIRDLQRL